MIRVQVYPSKARKTRATKTEPDIFKQPDFAYKGYQLPKFAGWARRIILGCRESQFRYRKQHFINQVDNHEGWIKDGHYFFEFSALKKDSALLTDMVCDYLKWIGHEANRIDTKGTAIIDRKAKPKFNLLTNHIETTTEVKFIATKTESGTEDIDVILFHPKAPYGVPWGIEIKAGTDKQSPEQKKRQARLQSKGTWSDVVKTMDDFFKLYDEKIMLLDAL